jgi:hypothetical protein
MILSTHGIIIPNSAPYTYLLDLYPGADAAFSLRKLSSTYSGSAIRVRRASDNTEQDIGFSGDFLDVASLSAFCSGTTGWVTMWYDQSSNSRVAYNFTASQQPLIYSISSVSTLNGKPSLEYLNNFAYLKTNSFTGGIVDSQFMVVRANVINCIISDGNNTNNISIWTTNTPGDLRVFAGNIDIASGIFPLNQQHLLTAITNGANSLIKVDNTEVTKNIGTNVRNGLTLGAHGGLQFNRLQGFFQEYINYPMDMTSSRVAIQTQINNYYGIY